MDPLDEMVGCFGELNKLINKMWRLLLEAQAQKYIDRSNERPGLPRPGLTPTQGERRS
jgi:hypothetical protein